ncbi:uncharacterized protein [Ptychodera flava]|uniref:uncharacterized protein n=1 Tax=Ptychodera flava TaxID=63121 RepID=UPI00396A7EE2
MVTSLLIICWAILVGVAASICIPEWITSPEDSQGFEGGNVTFKCHFRLCPGSTAPAWTQITPDNLPQLISLGNQSNSQRFSITGDQSIGEYNLQIRNISLQDALSRWQCSQFRANPQHKQVTLKVIVPTEKPKVTNSRYGNTGYNEDDEVSRARSQGKCETVQLYSLVIGVVVFLAVP